MEVTGVVFSTVEVGSMEDTPKGEDCDIPGIEMLVVFDPLGSLVLVAAGIKEKAALAGLEELVEAAVVVAKALEVPVGGNPENPKPEG